MVKGRWARLTLGIGFILLLASCANIMSPTGGPRDDKAPEIRKRSTNDSTLLFKGGKMTFEFNEFIKLQDVQRNLIVTPFLKAMPKVSVHKKRLTIDIHDSLLEPNTTYNISLGNAIQDIREGNVYSDLSFTFSTGSYFDSLHLHGTCIDASTGLPDTSVMVFLYPAALPDSAFIKSKPLYAKRPIMGNFSYDNLPNKDFRVYALHDENKNFTYDVGERIAFWNKPVNPADTSLFILLHTFTEKSTNDTTNRAPKTKRVLSKPAAVKSGMKLNYSVNVDTSAKSKSTFHLGDSLKISFDLSYYKLDKFKIRLFQDQVFDASVQIVEDTLKKQLKLTTQWSKDARYTLKLLKGFAVDSNNNEAPAGEFVFKTKKLTDYGYISVRTDTSASNVIQVIKNGNVIAAKYATDTLIQFNLLLPDSYQLRILKDQNKNGIWDAGQFFGEKRQPELTEQVPETLTVKANWENRVDVRRKSNTKKLKK